MADRQAAPDPAGVKRPRLTALLPSPYEQLLLEAALGPPEQAIPAFSAWLAITDLGAELGGDIVRLLPLLFHNQRAQGIETPVLGRFKGVYRRSWYESQRVMHRTWPAVECLQSHAIEPLVLDDMALALTCYAPPGLRSVTRLDLLVHRTEVRPALLLLRQAGWNSTTDGSEDDVRFLSYLRLFGPEDAEVRLHWEVLPGGPRRAERHSGQRAGTLPNGAGLTVSHLDPTSQLLRTVVQAHRGEAASRLHWVPDALMLLRKHRDTIEWPALQETAAAHRIAGLLGTGCGYLRAAFGAPIPPAVLTSLDRHRPPLMERIADAALVSHRGEGEDRRTIRVELLRYVERTRRLGNPLLALVDFSHLLRYRWNLSGRREILRTLFRDRSAPALLRSQP